MVRILKRYGAVFLLAALIIGIAATTIWIYVNKEVKQQDDFSGAQLVTVSYKDCLELCYEQ